MKAKYLQFMYVFVYEMDKWEVMTLYRRGNSNRHMHWLHKLLYKEVYARKFTWIWKKRFYIKCVLMFIVADEIVTNLIQTYILNSGKCVGLNKVCLCLIFVKWVLGV